MRRALAALPLVALTLAGLLFSEDQKRPEIPKPTFAGKVACDVIRVVDGDTVHVMIDGKDTTIRLIGIDTPETVDPRKPVQEYGREASQFMKNLVQGEQVYLEYEAEVPTLDKYGRLLAYLYRAPDGLFVNLEVVRQGYGFAYVKYPFKHMELFRYYEKAAREAKRGLWGLETPPGETPPATDPATPPKTEAPKADGGTPPADTAAVTVYSTDSGTKYHADGCRYLAKSKHAVSLKDAIARGLTPCSVCKPPTK